VNSAISISTRFREARERAELSHDEVASRMGLSPPCIWDIESHEEEICNCYSVAQVQRICIVLGIQPRDLFGFEPVMAPLSANELAAHIREHCSSRDISFEQFEDAAGWEVTKSLAEPERFRQDYPIDGIIDICGELGIAWQRFVESP